MKFTCGLLFTCLIGCAVSAPNEYQSIESNEIEQPSSWERMARMISSCVSGKDEMATCLGVKTATAINRASRMQKFEVLPGISFKRDILETIRDGKSLESENEITSMLPAEPQERSARVVDILKDSIFDFLQSHSLQVKLAPEEISGAARAFSEARGKIKKFMGPILLGVAVKVLAFLAIFGGGLALLVTKALIVSKLALVLASILGLQKLFNGNGSSTLLPSKGSQWASPGTSNAQWTTGGASQGWSNAGSSATGYPYARSIQAESQEMAYGAQKP